MICTILGCGSSAGVPEVCCMCAVCTSSNWKNKRLRSSIYVVSGETSLLIDTSSDFREQALRNNVTNVDAILYTHAHNDHFAGIDDTKNLNGKATSIPVFFDSKSAVSIMARVPYLFQPLFGGEQPKLIPNIISSSFQIGSIEVIPFTQVHGKAHSMGFRFGDLAYSTDISDMTDEVEEKLQGVKVWIVDCLRYAPAPTHAHLEKTLDWIKKIAPERAFLTHMSHDLDYDELLSKLPHGVLPVFDGLKISV